ncbi:MAG: hypothetical protein ACE5R4_14450 [Armatimonadota bacterium]
MTALTRQCEAARSKLAGLVRTVCGGCQKSCCHHGTMMGSSDLFRLHKGMLLDPEMKQRFLRGLARRTEELREDVRILLQVNYHLRSQGEHSHARLSRFKASLDAWEQFCDFADAIDDPDLESLRKLLWMPALRANCFRALCALPGAVQCLRSLASHQPSLRFSGRRMPPDRCLFHHQGCLAEDWKPAKCANFFCPADPSLLGSIFSSLSFYEFALANAHTIELEGLLSLVSIELQRGEGYVAPKVILAPRTEVAASLAHVLAEHGCQVSEEQQPGAVMMSAQEFLRLAPTGGRHATVLTVGSIEPAALYEIGLGVDQVRTAGEALAVYIVARALTPHSPLLHPLWEDRAMSQPVGALELYTLAD